LGRAHHPPDRGAVKPISGEWNGEADPGSLANAAFNGEAAPQHPDTLFHGGKAKAPFNGRFPFGLIGRNPAFYGLDTQLQYGQALPQIVMQIRGNPFAFCRCMAALIKS